MRFVGVRLPDHLYEELAKRARDKRVTVSELVRKAVEAYLGVSAKPSEAQATGFQELASKVAMLEQELTALKKQVEQLVERLAQSSPQSPPTTNTSATAPRPRRTAMDILREQRFIIEPEALHLRNRDAFFRRLEAEGAVILETNKGRVAVLPEAWEEFKAKLSSTSSASESTIRRELGAQLYRLFEFLRDAGEVYFDNKKLRWRLVSEPAGAEQGEAKTAQ